MPKISFQQIWKTMFEWFGCHPMVSIGRRKTTLFLATCDIASPISVSQFMYLGFLIIWINNQMSPLTFVVLNQVTCDI